MSTIKFSHMRICLHVMLHQLCMTCSGGGGPPPRGPDFGGGGGSDDPGPGGDDDAGDAPPDLLDIIAAEVEAPAAPRRRRENGNAIAALPPAAAAAAAVDGAEADVEVPDPDLGDSDKGDDDYVDWLEDDPAEHQVADGEPHEDPGHELDPHREGPPLPPPLVPGIAPGDDRGRVNALDMVRAADEEDVAAPAEPPAAAEEVEVEAGADARRGRRRRAGDDGWPRLWTPSRRACVRLSRNAAGVWDMRAICDVCGATLTRTCKSPDRRVRHGTKGRGQGKPLGRAWAWAVHADTLGEGVGHTFDAHQAYVPDLQARRNGRRDASAQPGVGQWLGKERGPNEVDLSDGEPRDLP